MERLKRLSLRTSLFLLMAVAASGASILSILVQNGCASATGRIMRKYTAVQSDNLLVVHSELSARDELLVQLLKWTSNLFPIVIFCLFIFLAARKYYLSKLERPIALLIEGADQISSHNLDFRLSYDGKDEMNEVVQAFEKMRVELENNHIKMWRAVEERRRLNAAFAHDLRTPITALKGYNDFLIEYLPSNQLTLEKTRRVLHSVSISIARIEQYVESMSSISRLEDIRVHKTDILPVRLNEALHELLSMHVPPDRLRYRLRMSIQEAKIRVDDELVIRVAENLISNAVRHAASEVVIECRTMEGELALTVRDDGAGFSGEGLRMAKKPYYHDPLTIKGQAGIGLYICEVLCRKHGGSLALANGENGGASVTAVFSCRN
ncbi:HAMP domain-containing histidine kinase [Paenibacillus sp. PR3]|uniref:histidine kinase n=1 Tax=Paenibacillus terricola TaxID=2763503 RepID=A0ABR8MR68_9BACL|nr:HAMP domain-containing sensor histidine kinase [Paenibacillus terricola]MBD3917407.1 HAMP domain-containing histidine kinase [Paenibacillus terricola]